MKCFLLITAFFIASIGFCQSINKTGEIERIFLLGNATFIETDSGIIINHYYQGSCKNILLMTEFIPSREKMKTVVALPLPVEHNTRLVTIHGDVSYDFFYRSSLDTPFAQRDLQQHTEKVNLHILLKEKYPLKIAFVLRQSNSPWFKNFANINFQFDQYEYQRKLKQRLVSNMAKALEQGEIRAVEKMLAEKKQQYSVIKNWLESAATLQKIIEERERKYKSQIQPEQQAGSILFVNDLLIDSLKKWPASGNNILAQAKQTRDSLSAFEELYNKRKLQLDTLSNELSTILKKADSVQNQLQKNLLSLRKKIYGARDVQAMMRIAEAEGIGVHKQDKLERRLAAIKSFGIGRSMVNYTELTAQNISVTGLNVEYNPSYYVAFAAGKIDYRFRDYYNRRNAKQNNQYLVLGRIGVGNPEKRALIFTIFQGRKNSTGYVLNDTVANHINIVGYSIESIFKKDEHTNISFEMAKSTQPLTGNLQANKQLNVLWKFSDQTNLGVNIKAQTLISETATKLSGFYRRTGENFQSFSLFSYNTGQVAWLARADQYFLKERIALTAMLRRNDFTNPFTDKTFKTSTIFKTLLFNIKIPFYPFISIGYYPGSQLYVVNEEKVKENAYYIMNGSMVYGYAYKGIRMNTSLVYNKYFNRATDSGFVLYKGKNYYAMQTLYLKKLQLQCGYTYNDQPDLKYFTIENSVDYPVNEYLKMAAGTKYNKINGGNAYWGHTLQLAADIKPFGHLQFQYEKSFLPTLNQSLYPVEMGRLSWYKYF